jgi:hypothetical protein
MPKDLITISLSEEEFSTILSALLFSCSINIVSSTTKEYQEKLFELAKKIKGYKPNVKLTDIQFLQEENYEDVISSNLIKDFKCNIETIAFENI